MNATFESSHIRFEMEGTSARVILDRPEVGNALSAVMVEDIARAMDAAEAAGARMILFRGTGRHMCTGFDLSDLDGSSDGDLLLRFVRVEQLLQKIYRSPLVTVAIASGRVYGAGADLFAACDRRIALPGAAFAFPGSGFGIVLGTRRLAARIGADLARRVLLAGGEVSAEKAAHSGLVTDPCDEDGISALLDDIHRTAQRLPPATVAALHAVTVSHDDDADLAALVASASHPGLKVRIVEFRKAVALARKPK